MTTQRPPELITVSVLSRELRQPAMKIRHVLDRYGIRPAATAGTVNIYHPDVLPELRRIFNTLDARRGASDKGGDE